MSFISENIQKVQDFFIYRDDLYPSLGGGNKARKMMALDKVLKTQGYNAIVTTGGIQSNHCRATAVYCQKYGMECTLVLHGNESEFHRQLGNAKIIRDTNASLNFCDPDEISETMDAAMREYEENSYKPFYLYGGGHTLDGGKAYIDAVVKMVENGFTPAQIYLPTGTGSTQAGILAGISKSGANTKVIGISVGRSKIKAEKEVEEFYHRLCEAYDIPCNGEIIVDDSFLCGGYQKYNDAIENIAKYSLSYYDILLDTTYTGKAFYGMQEILKENPVDGDILFWYTGGMFNYFGV
ncbi:1-aminocyclopropane-1-carboxylate deaminase/D-cysteine desulfhydrase [Flagellimonas olearia]|uniref:Tryptophan synthase beta chain-like PALP domain-containing protein n=1 Tax=Flagellimonas olearia TaxID=552546 RepID=A0A444VKX9_9FLAO|nr:pyridoxal-phosphate dependent enzyme [Allomuricauda olearia]RYC51437.1 hypothetical protein DN53_14670 [Allomuricauda olearia]